MAIFRTKLLRIDHCVSSVVAVQCNLFYRRRKCLTILVRSLWNGWIFQISSRNLNYYFDFEICPTLCLSFCRSFCQSFFWIRFVQNGSNLTKLDFSPIKKCYYKFSHLEKYKNGCFIFDFFVSDLSKMDQT